MKPETGQRHQEAPTLGRSAALPTTPRDPDFLREQEHRESGRAPFPARGGSEEARTNGLGFGFAERSDRPGGIR